MRTLSVPSEKPFGNHPCLRPAQPKGRILKNKEVKRHAQVPTGGLHG